MPCENMHLEATFSNLQGKNSCRVREEPRALPVLVHGYPGLTALLFHVLHGAEDLDFHIRMLKEECPMPGPALAAHVTLLT